MKINIDSKFNLNVVKPSFKGKRTEKVIQAVPNTQLKRKQADLEIKQIKRRGIIEILAISFASIGGIAAVLFLETPLYSSSKFLLALALSIVSLLGLDSRTEHVTKKIEKISLEHPKKTSETITI